MIYDFHLTDELRWTPEAEAKLKNVLFFARSQARQRVEGIARESELRVVTAELVEQVRLSVGQ
jgi:Proto-chlorophyllide reductase 57 kD subunit